METPASQIEQLIERVEAYGLTTLELTKLRAMDRGASILTELIARGSVILCFSLFAFMFNVGVALWLGEWLGRTYYGFFAVAVFYLIAAAVAHFFMRDWVREPISRLIQDKL